MLEPLRLSERASDSDGTSGGGQHPGPSAWSRPAAEPKSLIKPPGGSGGGGGVAAGTPSPATPPSCPCFSRGATRRATGRAESGHGLGPGPGGSARQASV
jgi:hypothetical protein